VINWAKPDYTQVYTERAAALEELRAKPGAIDGLKEYYADHWAQFVTDWGITYDPRNAGTDYPVLMPFILFPRQVEFMDWMYDSWKSRRRGLVEKSRELGASWLAVWGTICLFLFYPESTAGLGSFKKEKVDNGDGDPGSLFWKLRKGISMLPLEFIPKGFGEGNKWALVVNPETGSSVVGEIGDSIGVGSRYSLYIVDETDSLEHQMQAEASLATTTDCRIDISTANVVGSLYYNNRRSFAENQVFVFDWEEDPRKRLNPDRPREDEEWYRRQKRDLHPTAFASQVERDPAGAVANTFLSVHLIEEAETRFVSQVEQASSVPWMVGVDASGMGNDETVIWKRRGRLNLPPTTARKMDGVRLAFLVEREVETLLKLGPVGLIAVERDGPGGSCADQLLQGKFKEIVRAVHTGRKLSDGKNYNLRAWLHAEAKTYLEDSAPVLPKDPTFKAQATALLWESKGGLLLIESKDAYRQRLSGATSKVGKMAGRSPDRWDSFVLTFVPTLAKPITQMQVQVRAGARSWRPLDATLGY
jgi:phage terminase large subunit